MWTKDRSLNYPTYQNTSWKLTKTYKQERIHGSAERNNLKLKDFLNMASKVESKTSFVGLIGEKESLNFILPKPP